MNINKNRAFLFFVRNISLKFCIFIALLKFDKINMLYADIWDEFKIFIKKPVEVN